MTRWLITAFLFAIGLSFCKESARKIKRPANVTMAGSDTMILYKEDSSIKGSRKSLFLENIAQLMGLPPLLEMTDSFHIRIWLWNSKPNFAIDIKCKKNVITGNVLGFKVVKLDSGEYIQISYRRNGIYAKSGTPSFLQSLKKFNVLDNRSTTTFTSVSTALTGMSYVQFEIAQPDQYRYYEVLEPSFYRFVDKTSGDIDQFLKLLNEEFNIDVYHPDQNLFAAPKT
jgi:hypothetical protein